MKIESIDHLNTGPAETRKMESSASVAAFVKAIEKANNHHVAEEAAQREIVTSLKETKTEIERKARELGSALVAVQAEVDRLRKNP